MQHSTLWFCSLFLLLAAEASGQGTPPPQTFPPIPGGSQSAGMGWSVAAVGDFDGDGFGDFAAGEPYYFSGIVTTGRVRVFSGRNGGQIAVITGSNLGGASFGDEFGIAVAGAGDVDGDGFSDLVIGAPQGQRLPNPGFGPGYIEIHLGGGQGFLTRVFGAATGSKFGNSVSAAGHFDADGYGDILVGAPNESGGPMLAGAGAVYVLSGEYLVRTARGQVPVTVRDLFVARGTSQLMGTGWSVHGPLDVDGNGIDDFLVGSSHYTGTLGAAIDVHLGRTGTKTSYSPLVGGGGYHVRGIGDVDEDGRDDFVGVSPITSPIPGGFAQVFSGAQGISLYFIDSSRLPSEAVLAADGAGDFNGDGVPDLVVGEASRSRTTGIAGRVRAIDGATGRDIWTMVGQPGENLGFAVSGAGDLQGSGVGNILIGAPTAPPFNTGLVYVLGEPQPYIALGDDLALKSSVGGGMPGTRAIHSAVGGNLAMFQIVSPRGTLNGAPPFLFGQLYQNGSPPAPLAPFPYVYVNPFGPGGITLFGGTLAFPFGGFVLRPGGVTLGFYRLPAGLAGFTVRLQAAAFSPLARNGLGFAVSNAHEIVVN